MRGAGPPDPALRSVRDSGRADRNGHPFSSGWRRGILLSFESLIAKSFARGFGRRPLNHSRISPACETYSIFFSSLLLGHRNRSGNDFFLLTLTGEESPGILPGPLIRRSGKSPPLVDTARTLRWGSENPACVPSRGVSRSANAPRFRLLRSRVTERFRAWSKSGACSPKKELRSDG